MASYECARWGCKRKATYERPLCHGHWIEWERWELEECHRCHWFYGGEEITSWFPGTKGPVAGKQTSVVDSPPLLCQQCAILTQDESLRGVQQTILNSSMKPGERTVALARLQSVRALFQTGWLAKVIKKVASARLRSVQAQFPTQERQPHAHATITRPVRWIYVLKLADGSFYIGQTTDIFVRKKEHDDGLQSQTKGKSPSLVYFERFEGEGDVVRARENELTQWNQNGFGRRRLRQLIEAWQAPLRLIEWDS